MFRRWFSKSNEVDPIYDLYRHVPLFNDLSKKNLKKLVSISEEVSLKANEYIFMKAMKVLIFLSF